MKADHFVLTLQLGNDAMRTWGDIVNALRLVADSIDDRLGDEPESDDGRPIHDANGNRVGGWHTSVGLIRCKWWDSCPTFQRGQLGDNLVLDEFDWRDWFDSKPSRAFMNEVDYLRMLWEGSDNG